jgi:hypothetical protein
MISVLLPDYETHYRVCSENLIIGASRKEGGERQANMVGAKACPRPPCHIRFTPDDFADAPIIARLRDGGENRLLLVQCVIE